MRKLAKYLKPFILTLLVCFIMLFGQAMCDLNLPNLMSGIVNVGIQQKGVQNAAPEAISENGFLLMRVFMTDEQKALVDKSYQKVTAGGTSEEDKIYQEKYPILKSETIYVRQTKDKDSIEQLNDCFGKSSIAMISVMQQIAKQQSAGAASVPDDMSKVDFSKVYSMLPMLEKLPNEMIAQGQKVAEEVDSSVRQQTGVMLTEQFYKEIGVDLQEIQNNYIGHTGFYMIVLTLLGAIATITVSFFASRIAAGVSKNLRRDVFRKVESFSNTEFDQFSTASLITRTTNDITQIQSLIMMGIRMICYAPIMGIGGIVMALDKSVSMSWVIAVGVIVLIGLILTIFAIALPKFKAIQKLVDKLNLVTREHLSGMMVIRAFGTQKFEENRFDQANKDLTNVNRFVNRVMAFMMPAMMFIMNTISLLIVWVGSHQIAESNMQVGDMMAYMQYAMQIIMAFLMISMMFIMVPRAAVSADRISEVLETEPVIRDKRKVKKLPENHTGKIEFKNVTFRYSGATDNVLENINFTALPGQTTAFIGSTGSGKTTLINLIPRFYDVTQGQILLDGVDIRDISQHELHENIGYVPQKAILFSGDISSNLRYGDKEASDETVKTAADVAQATEFILATEGGFHNPIAQGGGNVSGGQKQRLSIARALVKKAKVYIFDDSFSALDYKTDAKLRAELKGYTKDATVLIVAQRVSTIMNAEQIIVLDEGKIVGIGTHKELLKICPTYEEIASSQLSKEELQ